MKRGYAWKGGKHLKAGYVLVYDPSHPNSRSNGYVLEHRKVMEEHIGRFLSKKEIVHHINEIRDDNRIENLCLFKSNGEHISNTQTGKVRVNKRIYKHVDFLPTEKIHGEVVVLSRKKYIVVECIYCKKLFWTKFRTERPLTKTCGIKCLAKLSRRITELQWKEGKYGNRRIRNVSG